MPSRLPRLVLLCCFAVVGIAAAQDRKQKISEKDLRFFEAKVRPLLIKHCYGCHAEQKKKTKGGLALDSQQGWSKGGDSGAVIVPRIPDNSLLYKAVTYEDSDLQMPPKGKLNQTEIATIYEWIKRGAPDPRTQSTAASKPSTQIDAKELWSFQPLVKVEPPPVTKEDWNRDWLDRFVFHRLADVVLTPAPIAKPHELLRRLHFVTTGIPPTEDELDTFERACEEDLNAAIDKTVDALLANPGFGDRWARHWLDLTAYADTIGIGRSIPALEAYRYRDYVINAFNDNKPYDEFVFQQVAGDIQIPAAPGITGTPPPTAEAIVATGFLAIGPWELVGGDKEQLRMDVVDRQVNRVGKVFLGLTLECSRCHAHKFDPISQEDYFALAGIFRSTVTFNGRINGVFSDINHRVLPESADDLLMRASRVQEFQDEVDSLNEQQADSSTESARLKLLIARDEKEKKSVEQNKAKAAELQKRIDESKKRVEELKSANGRRSARLAVLKFIKRHRTESRAMAVMDTPEPEDAYINIRGNAHQLGPKVARGFPKKIAPADEPAFTRGGSGRAQLAEWLVDKRNPLTARVWVNRVWHHLFGAGLVRSVDNFGKMGERPSHPQLLDRLALEFMDTGWNTKRLIKRIVTSRTWQQSANNVVAVKEAANDLDPDNRLLWRANRRRLDAEVLRDSMLFVSGLLISNRGGPSIPLDVPGNLSPGSTGSLGDAIKLPPSFYNRRAVYLPQKRKGPFDVISFIGVFDLPDTNQETGRRTVTTVPAQALNLANSAFTKQCATQLAKATSSLGLEERVTTLYRRLFSRRPSSEEVKVSREFVTKLVDDIVTLNKTDRSAAESDAWMRYCQALLMTNEFLFSN